MKPKMAISRFLVIEPEHDGLCNWTLVLGQTLISIPVSGLRYENTDTKLWQYHRLIVPSSPICFDKGSKGREAPRCHLLELPRRHSPMLIKEATRNSTDV